MTSHHQDDGFHEIQLNGKQLVFLFMAATVVSVVIFLCGVLVGRGVRAERGSLVETAALDESPTADPRPSTGTTSGSVAAPAGSDPTTAAPPPTVDDLSYFNRLEKQNLPAEQLKPAPSPARETDRPASAAKAVPSADRRSGRPASVSSAATPPQEAARSAAAPVPPANETAREGYAVQIAALNSRGEADAIVKRLSSKGYAAYVLAPASGTPSFYRVRVGTFTTRREAESVAAKLQKEEQFKPWVTR